MKMTLIRKVFGSDRTLGELHLEGVGYFCDTLEPHCIDWSKEQKTPGKTAIPEGRYKVKVGWSPKAGKNVPWLKKVPHFRDIQIHTGNVPAHTRGCILVGSAEKNVLIDSRIVFNSLMNLLKFEKDIEIVVTHENEDDKKLRKLFPWYVPSSVADEEEYDDEEEEDEETEIEYMGDELEKFL